MSRIPVEARLPGCATTTAEAVTMSRFWSFLDTLWHSIGLPGGWACDRYDLALGLTRDELTRR